jgi:hypothetical protein
MIVIMYLTTARCKVNAANKNKRVLFDQGDRKRINGLSVELDGERMFFAFIGRLDGQTAHSSPPSMRSIETSSKGPAVRQLPNLPGEFGMTSSVTGFGSRATMKSPIKPISSARRTTGSDCVLWIRS